MTYTFTGHRALGARARPVLGDLRPPRRRHPRLRLAPPRPWLYGIASNLIARHHRAEMRQYRALSRLGAPRSFDDDFDGRIDAARPAGTARRGPARDRRARPRGAAARRVGRAELRGGGASAGHPGGHGPLAAAPGAREDTCGARRRPEEHRPMTDLQTLHDAWDPPRPARPRRPRRGPCGPAPTRRATPRAAPRAGRGGGGRGRRRDQPRRARPAGPALLRRGARARRRRRAQALRGAATISGSTRRTASTEATHVRWRRADGVGMASVENGRLQVEIMSADPRRGRPAKLLFDGYDELAALPTDPRCSPALGVRRGEEHHGRRPHGARRRVRDLQRDAARERPAARPTASARPRTGSTRSCCSSRRC